MACFRPFLKLSLKQFTRLYLNDLGDVAGQSLGVGIVKLVVETKKRTPERVRQLVNQARSELADEMQRKVLDLIETVVLYKFPRINRQELAIMFGLNELRKTRSYQEVRQEAREELQDEVRQQVQEVRQQVRQELQEEVRQETSALIRRQLLRRLGAVNPQIQKRIAQLSVPPLESLADALLDFSNEADLAAWLDNSSNQIS